VHQQRLSPSARNVDLKAPSDAIIGSACAYPATRPDKISRPEVERRKGEDSRAARRRADLRRTYDCNTLARARTNSFRVNLGFLSNPVIWHLWRGW
jgi:hypothetical protein